MMLFGKNSFNVIITNSKSFRFGMDVREVGVCVQDILDAEKKLLEYDRGL
jgi:hypothetical protein